jgi:ring-1,2-phenylacetyl-CoA epoxidase subunit PaaC
MPSLPPIRPEDEAAAAKQPPVGAFDAPALDAPDQLRFEYLLRLGDDSLVLGQRLAEWTGRAPSVEVDLSLANFRARPRRPGDLLPEEAGKCEGRGATATGSPSTATCSTIAIACWSSSRMATSRAPWRASCSSRPGRSCCSIICALARRLIAAVAAKAVKEVTYHEELAAEWVIRLGDGTEESRRRVIDGLDWNWRFVPELFEMDEVAAELAARGVGADLAALRPAYEARIAAVLAEATLERPRDQRPILGGRRGHHSEHLGHLLATMQFLPRAYPDAKW